MTTLTLESEKEIETIARMAFRSSDVLDTPRERITRKANLLKAVVLDSLYKSAVVLTLEDLDSTRKLRARIIATGDERVMLEKGISIPVYCISSVEFT